MVIAAYAAALRERGHPRRRASAFEASLLLGSVITAGGAYHHTLAEGDRILVERLAAEFSRRDIYPLSHHAVDALMAEQGTARPSVRRAHGPRYERSRPNELWHIDIKGPFFLQRARGQYTKVWIVGLVDDHSRFLIGLRVLPRPSTEPVLAWLRDCFELCGVPLEVMSDNGAPFVVWMPGVLTLFGRTLAELHVRHIRTQVNSPWTNGKIERFWGVLRSELLDREVFPTPEAADDALARFAVYYDYHRLHGELGWQTPAERWDGTPFTDRSWPSSQRQTTSRPDARAV